MIKSKEELLKDFSAIIGENNSDEAISFIENLTDSMTSVNADDVKALNDKIETLEQEKKNIDTEWRNKYKARFFDTPIKPEPENEEKVDEVPQSFDDLFSTKE